MNNVEKIFSRDFRILQEDMNIIGYYSYLFVIAYWRGFFWNKFRKEI